MTGQNEQDKAVGREALPEQPLQKKTRGPNAFARHSLWQLILFMLLSILALRLSEFSLLQLTSENFRAFLGPPPPAYLVTVALTVYCFSVLTLILNQMSNNAEPQPRWSHLGYRSAFYLFYALSGTLVNHFMAVFFIGLLLYGVEQVHVWMHYNRVAHQDKELLGER